MRVVLLLMVVANTAVALVLVDALDVAKARVRPHALVVVSTMLARAWLKTNVKAGRNGNVAVCLLKHCFL